VEERNRWVGTGGEGPEARRPLDVVGPRRGECIMRRATGAAGLAPGSGPECVIGGTERLSVRRATCVVLRDEPGARERVTRP